MCVLSVVICDCLAVKPPTFRHTLPVKVSKCPVSCKRGLIQKSDRFLGVTPGGLGKNDARKHELSVNRLRVVEPQKKYIP